MASAAIITNKKEEVIMPRNDKTGPEGKGPMTGRRMGSCAENMKEGSEEKPVNFRRRNRFRDRDDGRGRGRGFGRQNRRERPNPS